MKTLKEKNRLTEIGSPGNGAENTIKICQPYIAEVTIQGSADILFHKWDCDAVKEKADSAKGSKAKKSDDLESYVYRNDQNELCIPGEYLRMAIIGAAKFQQDPRSPRKSAQDLFKAAVVSITHLASLGTKEWDYEDRRRCVIQRNAITRTRPAMKAGWKVTIQLQILLPEYVSPDLLHSTIISAGRLIGLADFRPTFGRFLVTKFEVLDL